MAMTEMKAKSKIPFLKVPLAMVMLAILVADAMREGFDPRMDTPRYIFWSVLCASWIISGVIKWNTPYITEDDAGVTVRGRWFSNEPTLFLPWERIKRHTGRTLTRFGIESPEGTITRIPINGISARDLKALLARIEERTGNAN